MIADELIDVPTVAELTRRGLAKAEPSKGGTVYRISDEGQRLIRDAMSHNAAILKRDHDARSALIEQRRAQNAKTTEETLADMKRSELGHKRARQIADE